MATKKNDDAQVKSHNLMELMTAKQTEIDEAVQDLVQQAKSMQAQVSVERLDENPCDAFMQELDMMLQDMDGDKPEVMTLMDPAKGDKVEEASEKKNEDEQLQQQSSEKAEDTSEKTEEQVLQQVIGEPAEKASEKTDEQVLQQVIGEPAETACEKTDEQVPQQVISEPAEKACEKTDEQVPQQAPAEQAEKANEKMEKHVPQQVTAGAEKVDEKKKAQNDKVEDKNQPTSSVQGAVPLAEGEGGQPAAQQAVNPNSALALIGNAMKRKDTMALAAEMTCEDDDTIVQPDGTVLFRGPNNRWETSKQRDARLQHNLKMQFHRSFASALLF